MKIVNASLLLKKNGLSLEQIYQASSSEFSVLHGQACREFLRHEIPYHEFYCDMKKLEQLKEDEVAFGLYQSTRSGFSTEIVCDENEFDEIIKLIKRDLLDTVLLFRFRFHSGKLSLPAGAVYKVVSD